MKGKDFLDTNIFVYSFDKKEPGKQARSRDLIREALNQGGCVSWQVVQEFANVAFKGFQVPFESDMLREYLDSVLLPLCALFPDKDFYKEAVGVQWETRFSWYDSLIVTAAVKLGCTTLFSEDLQHGRIFRGLTIIDPFR